MLSDPTIRLEVWGDPIAHSRSPQLHHAAYATLGLPWHYDRRRVAAAAFPAELAGLDARWRGLSLTMPLKAAAFAAAVTHDRHAALTGVANTLLLDDAGPRAFNTDVGGLRRALSELCVADAVADVGVARIVGAGATAVSAVIALHELGARRIEVVARRHEAVAALSPLADALGLTIVARALEAGDFDAVPVTVATLPGDIALPNPLTASLAAGGGQLVDVVYGHWPTALSTAWDVAAAPAASGAGMLLHQALLQVRVFVGGDIDVPLDDEPAVLAAMRLALMGD